MKVAVTAQRGEASSPLDPRFGRAPWFVVVDTATSMATVHDNRHAAGAAHGAGPQAVQRIADLGAQALITGNVGPKAWEALSAAGIEVYLTYAGSVQSAVDRLVAGRLSRAERPSKAGH